MTFQEKVNEFVRLSKVIEKDMKSRQAEDQWEVHDIQESMLNGEDGPYLHRTALLEKHAARTTCASC